MLFETFQVLIYFPAIFKCLISVVSSTLNTVIIPLIDTIKDKYNVNNESTSGSTCVIDVRTAAKIRRIELLIQVVILTRDLHGPGGPAGRAGTGRADAGRAHKPTKWNGPGRAGLSHPTGRAGPGFTFFR